MAQKSYRLEIVNELLKSRNHIRGLSKTFETNHMIVLRKMKGLFDSNVVDYKEEGKNKVYFLKKTAEARIYVLMSENYKLLKIIEKYPLLRQMIEKIQKNKKIKLSVLFGSYAKEIAKKTSDVDIYVETVDKKIKQELEMIDSNVSVKIGKYDKQNNLIAEIEKNHVIIKGVEKYYENTGFFE